MTEKYIPIETKKQSQNCDFEFATKHIKFATTKSLYEMQACKQSKRLKYYIEKEQYFLEDLFSKKYFEKLVGTKFTFSIYLEDNIYISIGSEKKQLMSKIDYDIFETFEQFVGRNFLLFQSMKYDLEKGFISGEENIKKIVIQIGLDSQGKNFVKDVKIIKKK